MDKLCSQCQLAFQAKRVTARYCSPKCRNDAFRGVSVVNDSVAIVSVAQKKAVSVVTELSSANATAVVLRTIPVNVYAVLA